MSWHHINEAQSYRILAYGEVLWDIFPTGAYLGGAPFNFAYRMASLGHKVSVVSRVGSDSLGDQTIEKIRLLGLDTSWIQRDPVLPTGTVEVKVGVDGNPHFYITPNVAYDQIELSPELLSLAQEVQCICFGSLIQRSSQSRNTLYAMLDAATGAIKICDINLRPNCFTYETIRESIRRATILKLSEEEVPIVAESLGIVADPIEEFCFELLTDTRVVIIIVTLGPWGALAATSSGNIHYEPGWQVKVKDCCGAGDAFTAGFIHAILQDKSIEEACRFANALGALVTETTGATEQIDLGKLKDLFSEQAARNVLSQLKQRLIERGYIV